MQPLGSLPLLIPPSPYTAAPTPHPAATPQPPACEIQPRLPPTVTATAATKDYPVERLGNPGDGHGPVRHNGRLYVSGMVGIVDTDGELLVRIPPLSHPP